MAPRVVQAPVLVEALRQAAVVLRPAAGLVRGQVQALGRDQVLGQVQG